MPSTNKVLQPVLVANTVDIYLGTSSMEREDKMSMSWKQLLSDRFHVDKIRGPFMLVGYSSFRIYLFEKNNLCRRSLDLK